MECYATSDRPRGLVLRLTIMTMLETYIQNRYGSKGLFRIDTKIWPIMFRPAFWCMQHPKAGRNTQHILLFL